MDNEFYAYLSKRAAVNFVGIVCATEGLNRTVKVYKVCATITADRCETREMPRHQMAHDRCNLIPLGPGAFAFGVYIFFFLSKTPVLRARVYVYMF